METIRLTVTNKNGYIFKHLPCHFLCLLKVVRLVHSINKETEAQVEQVFPMELAHSVN